MNDVNIYVYREGEGSESSDAFFCSIHPSMGVLFVCEVESSLLIVEDEECIHEME